MKKRNSFLLFLVLVIFGISIWSYNNVLASGAVDQAAAIVASTEGDIDMMAADTHYVSMDLADVQIGTVSGQAGRDIALRSPLGVEPSPWIIWRSTSTNQTGICGMTLDSRTGSQKGDRLNLEFLSSWQPVGILLSKQFALPLERGIEPSPWIVFRDYRLYTFTLSFYTDGTPIASAPHTISPSVDSMVYGHASCAAELPGSEFADGKSRLFVGTDLGYVVVFATAIGGGIGVTDILSVSSAPIVKLHPIPQCGFIALGALTGNVVKGIQYVPGKSQSLQPNSYTSVFTLVDPRTPALTDFDTFGPHDAVLPSCMSTLGLVLANGSEDLALTRMAANQTGAVTLTLTLDHHAVGISSVATGSMLMLAGDGSAIMFDPYYSEQTGSSGCDLNVSDGMADECQFLCGNANGDGMVNISDVVFLISYIFGGGAAPNPLLVADANCDGVVNISDAVYLISYIFAGGPAPCAECKY